MDFDNLLLRLGGMCDEILVHQQLSPNLPPRPPHLPLGEVSYFESKVPCPGTQHNEQRLLDA